MLLFKNNIGNYATLLGLTAGRLAAQAADADYFSYIVQCANSVQSTAQGWTAQKASIRRGKTSPVSTTSNLTFPTAPTAVAPGVERRFRALVKQVKAHANYNVAMGQGLGIEAAEQAAPDMTTLQPELGLMVSGGRVQVDWGWQKCSRFLDLCELQVDRGDGKGFGMLTFDTTPGFTDPMVLPSVPAKWSYRAVYRVADNRVGQWSNVVSITVGG